MLDLVRTTSPYKDHSAKVDCMEEERKRTTRKSTRIIAREEEGPMY